MNALCKLKKWSVPLIFFILFVIFSLLVNCISAVTTADLALMAKVQHLLSFVDVYFWAGVSALHHDLWALIVVLATLFLVYKKDYKLAILYFICVQNAPGITTYIKGIFQRHRPPIEFQPLQHYTHYSYPSGHTLNIVVLLGFLVIIIFKYVKCNLLKYSLLLICVYFILLVGLSRNMLGAHYPTDVLGSFLLGLALLTTVHVIDKSE